MLRITRSDDATRLLLKLEGRIVGDWVAVLADELDSLADANPALVLDLSGVEFATDAGVDVLLAARARGVQLLSCSPLLASLLEGRAS